MNRTIFWNHAQNIAEYTIALILIAAGIQLFLVDPLTSSGPVGQVLGGIAAATIYGIIFCAEGVALAYSKVRQMKKLHKNMLMVIYLTAIFVTILEWTLIGFGWILLDQLILFLVSGACWIRWKFRTEYIDPALIYAEAHPLREDIPDLPRSG